MIQMQGKVEVCSWEPGLEEWSVEIVFSGVPTEDFFSRPFFSSSFWRPGETYQFQIDFERRVAS